MKDTVSADNQNAWDADFAAMDNQKTIDAELIDGEADDVGNISRPVHKSHFLKIIVLFLGGVTITGAVAFAFFGGSFGGKQQVANTPKTTKETPLSVTDQERLANAEAANAMGGSAKAFDSHKQETTVAASPAAQKPTEDTAKTAQSTATTKQTAPKASTASEPAGTTATLTPVTYQQPPRTSIQAPTHKHSTSHNAEINALTKELNKLKAIVQAQKETKASSVAKQPITIATAPKPVLKETKATTVTKAIPEVKPAKEPAPEVQQVAMVTPAIDTRAIGKLHDAITVASGDSSYSNSQKSQQARIQLEQPIFTTDGLQIPSGSIISMRVAVANNGLVTGSSIGVWDIKTGLRLNVPEGAFVLDGDGGRPLIAGLLKPNGQGAQGAQMETAMWNAAATGVDAITRPDSSSSATSGIGGSSISTSTSGGDRGFLVNAAGGFARGIVSAREKDAAEAAKKISAQSELWHLDRGTRIILSARPILPESGATFSQYRKGVSTQSVNTQYSDPYRTNPYLAPPPSRYAQKSR